MKSAKENEGGRRRDWQKRKEKNKNFVLHAISQSVCMCVVYVHDDLTVLRRLSFVCIFIINQNFHPSLVLFLIRRRISRGRRGWITCVAGTTTALIVFLPVAGRWLPVCACIHTRTVAHTYMPTRTPWHTCTRTHMHTHTHTHAHAHTSCYTRTHMHAPAWQRTCEKYYQAWLWRRHGLRLPWLAEFPSATMSMDLVPYPYACCQITQVVNIQTYARTHMHTCEGEHTHMHTYKHTHTQCVQVHTHTCEGAHTHTHTHKHTHTICAGLYRFTYICVYVFIHICQYKKTYGLKHPGCQCVNRISVYIKNFFASK